MHLNNCFELDDPEIKKHNKWTLKRLKLGMVSSFHPHSMCQKVEMVRAVTGCTSCTKWTISFKVSGFQTKTPLLQRHFNFLNLFQRQSFCVFSMHHSKPRHQLSTLSEFICYFSCIYWFFWAKWPWNWKALQIRNGWKLAWYHHFIHIAGAKKLRGLRQKLDALRVQNGQSLSKYQGFRRKLLCFKGISFF